MNAKWLALAWMGTTFCRAQAPADLFNQAPPPVEQALRSRVAEFYQAQSEGKFRLADTWVAEDSKDVYFEGDKRRCAKFSISRLSYTGQFTKAEAMVLCETDMMMPPQGVMRVTMPLLSKWKILNGQWMWYVVPADGHGSPFGQMNPGSGDGVPMIGKGPSVADLHKMFRAEKDMVRFSNPAEATESVELKSDFAGELQLSLNAPLAKDLKVELDRTILPSKETALLKITYMPRSKRSPLDTEEIRISALPINKTIVVKVTFGSQ